MSLEQRQTDAYREGATACRAGAHRCPYGAGDPRADDWLAGWRATMGAWMETQIGDDNGQG